MVSLLFNLLFYTQIDGLVMVDIKKYYSDIDSEKSKRHSTKPEVSYLIPQKAWVTDCFCPVCRKRKEEKLQEQREPEMFTDYHGVFPENQTLTSHHFFLLPTKIWGFVFKIRTWGRLPYHNRVQVTDDNYRETSYQVFPGAEV